MQADDATSPLDEGFERRAIGVAHVAGVAFVDDEHRDAFELLRERRMQGARDDSTVLRQQLAPVGEELRVVMLARSVGLETGPKVNLYTVYILAGDGGRLV